MYAEALRATLSAAFSKPARQNRQCRECLAGILEALVAMQQVEIGVGAAARMAGKSPCQIRRMIRQGQLTRCGGDGERLRVRMVEVPMSKEQRSSIIQVQIKLAAALRQKH